MDKSLPSAAGVRRLLPAVDESELATKLGRPTYLMVGVVFGAIKSRCQMYVVEAGIWSVFDPRTCCGRLAPFHIVVWGEKWWLCAQPNKGHIETRGILHIDGEGLDANGVKL